MPNLVLVSFSVAYFGVAVIGLEISQQYQHAPTRNQLQQLGSFEPLDLPAVDASLRRVTVDDWLSHGPVLFEDAWNVQKEYLQLQIDRLQNLGSQCDTMKESGMDRIIFLQHSPVYTLGTASDPSFIYETENTIPVVRMDRGGEVTYHGPGQLTVYPILDLRRYRQDIHWYMRALEECVLLALHNIGISDAYRDNETTGVWVQNHKIAALGIKCKRWVTQHGVAINVEYKCLDGFEGIIPCGLEGRKVGCINQFLPPEKQLTAAQFSRYMVASFEQTFCVELVQLDK